MCNSNDKFGLFEIGKNLMDTYTLGLSCYNHDSAAALIKNGEIIAAAQEERFSKKKSKY